MTDGEWWQAYCLRSLAQDPWREEEFGKDGRGYVVMQPDIKRRRREYKEKMR